MCCFLVPNDRIFRSFGMMYAFLSCCVCVCVFSFFFCPIDRTLWSFAMVYAFMYYSGCAFFSFYVVRTTAYVGRLIWRMRYVLLCVVFLLLLFFRFNDRLRWSFDMVYAFPPGNGLFFFSFCPSDRRRWSFGIVHAFMYRCACMCFVLFFVAPTTSYIGRLIMCMRLYGVVCVPVCVRCLIRFISYNGRILCSFDVCLVYQ